MGTLDTLLVPDGIDFASYYRITEPHQKVRPAESYRDEVIADLSHGAADDIRLPWAKTHRLVGIRPGEVSIWAGINGHGKSLMSGQVVSGLCLQGEKVCIASFEMKPRKTLHRMLRQAGKGSSPTPEFAQGWLKWLVGRLWLYDQQGTVTPETMYGVVKFCAEELGIGHVVIDSLMKCVKSEEDMDGQKAFVDEITSLARDLNIHVHLVHHIRKGTSEHELPNKFGVKGSGSITDQVDNVFIVWKNKKKIDAMQSGGEYDDAKDPDAMLICEKQRNGEFEGRFGLWFDRSSQQFCEDFRRQLLRLHGAPE
jgi:twinkle protein